MLNFTSEQKMIQKEVARLAREKIAPLAVEADAKGHSSPEIIKLLADHDLLKAAVPEKYDGIGADYTTLAIIMEELARVDTSAAMIAFATQTFIQILNVWGSEAQKDRFFSQMSAGDKINAFVLTESDYGSESASIQTSAVLDKDHYVVNGSKIFITNADIADFFMVFLRTGEGEREKGLSALMIERDTPGLSVGKHENKLGFRGSDLSELVFKDARVPVENLLGQAGKGWQILISSGSDMRAYGPGAMAVGLAQGALDYAIDYAKNRVQFGRPIARFQGLRFMLADMSIQLEAARSLLYRTTGWLDANLKDAGKRSRLVSSAKCFASDVAMRVTTDAIQIMGGQGVMKDYPLERMMRDAKMIQIFDGSNQIQRVIVAKNLLS